MILIPGTDRSIVQTVDFFPPIVDDPRDFGRIAAANSLSDIYAMGGTPLSALNIVGFPEELPMSILGEILAGGAEKMVEAKCALLGGHSVRDSEVKYGLAVTGTIDQNNILTNGGAQVGDVLVLTKGLGTGSVSTAVNKDQVSADVLQAATTSMSTLNASAALAAIALEAQAVTDVTGFGLCGHGTEMARASGVTLEFSARKLPLLEGAGELAMAGCISGGSGRSSAHLGEQLEVATDVPDHLRDLATDSETSGGLLMAISQQRIGDLDKVMEEEGVTHYSIIGEVKPAEGSVTIKIIA